MPRPIRPWLRLYVEVCRDPKVRRLTPDQRWIWIGILCAARESCQPGELFVAPGLPMSTQELADFSGVKAREVDRVLPLMQGMSMVTVEDSGLVRVLNWDHRQFESDDVTKRTRDHRERSRERSNDVPGNAPETETETETEDERADKPPRAKRAHQAPDDFAPNETNLRVAAEHGVDLTRVLPQFLDHHRARGSTFKDWHLALNTWIRRERSGPVTPIHQQRATASHRDARTLERPPDGLTDEESAAWLYEQAAKHR